ncbi:C40 family peptidase [Streptomyces sp. NPDC005408]|uniref:C40 family peptidase n=1 Tax=Streptomyces sp. NPDC005408 TaxID=3155341 RepID=UPI0033B60987
MSGSVLRSVCTAALVAATALAAVPAAAEPVADPVTEPVVQPADQTTAKLTRMLTQLQTLYRQAEEAGETYNATEEELTKQRAETARLSGELATARDAVAASHGEAGRLARLQYQGRSELSSYLELLLARNPRQALDQDHLIERAASERLATTTRLEAGARRAAGLETASRKALDKEQTLAARQKKASDAAASKLKAVEAMLASLSPEQLAGLTALEQSGTDKAQEKLIASGALAADRTPTEEGEQALQYAVGQIGKPYLWGAEGPESYDCSGLTSQAWAKAGLEIPRTSQEQWQELPKVPLRSLRPGDLVVYFPEATHVAIYLGGGMVVQAPRPGATVKVSPIAANPLLGAVRPDPDGSPLSSYTPPQLPDGATAGPDTGYSEAEPPADAPATEAR